MKTLIELFEKSVEKYPENPLLWEKVKDRYVSSSYLEIHRQVILFGAGAGCRTAKGGPCGIVVRRQEQLAHQ